MFPDCAQHYHIMHKISGGNLWKFCTLCHRCTSFKHLYLIVWASMTMLMQGNPPKILTERGGAFRPPNLVAMGPGVQLGEKPAWLLDQLKQLVIFFHQKCHQYLLQGQWPELQVYVWQKILYRERGIVRLINVSSVLLLQCSFNDVVFLITLFCWLLFMKIFVRFWCCSMESVMIILSLKWFCSSLFICEKLYGSMPVSLRYSNILSIRSVMVTYLSSLFSR